MSSRLYRSSQSKVIGGVSGGLGEYLNIDPVIIRIIFVLLTIFH
ncbi:MAG: PspC domain-containing protein, partial [Melioribacteraceae bacterium]|nr:PspC domain-containing protein [Melioribacteraceae bacterium]